MGSEQRDMETRVEGIVIGLILYAILDWIF